MPELNVADKVVTSISIATLGAYVVFTVIMVLGSIYG